MFVCPCDCVCVNHVLVKTTWLRSWGGGGGWPWIELGGGGGGGGVLGVLFHIKMSSYQYSIISTIEFPALIRWHLYIEPMSEKWKWPTYLPCYLCWFVYFIFCRRGWPGTFWHWQSSYMGRKTGGFNTKVYWCSQNWQDPLHGWQRISVSFLNMILLSYIPLDQMDDICRWHFKYFSLNENICMVKEYWNVSCHWPR